MAPASLGSPRLYTAFLSYSHAADGRLAPAVQAGLHHFARPWYRLRALRIFRDKTSLSATPALWPSIERALESSEWFLLFASPDAAASQWVRQEIQWWLAHRPPEKMLVVLTDGELVWNTAARDFDWSATTALPSLLAGTFADEPLYVDLRWARKSEELSIRHTQFRAAILDLATPLHGRPKDELDGEDVRQHRRTRRISWAAGTLLVLLTIASAVAAYVALAQRQVAVRQTQLALSRLLAVESNRMLPEQLDLALLLAAAADQSTPTLEARAALRSAFQRSPRVLRFLDAGRAPVLSVAAAPGSDTLLSIGENGTLTAWSRDTGTQLSSVRLTEQQVTAAAFSAAGTTLAVGTGDGAILVADAVTGRAVPIQTHHRLAVRILAFSRDGLTLASAGADGTVAVWDPATGRRKDHGRIRGSEITSIALSPDGESIAANVNGPGPSRVLVSAVSRSEAPTEIAGTKAISDVVFGPGGTVLAFSDRDDRLVVWDVSRKRRLRLLGDGETWITSLAIHPQGTKVVTGGGDGSVVLWDLANNEEPTALREHSQAVSEVTFSADGTHVATRAGREVMLHDLQDRRRSIVLGGHPGEVRTMAFTPDSGALVTGDDKGRVLVWSSSTGRQSDVVTIGDGSIGEGEVHSVAFDPDGTLLAAGSGGGAITLWDVAGGRPVRVIDGHRSAVVSMSFSPDGNTLATGSLDRTVKLRDVRTSAVVGDWPGHESKIVTVAFRPDGKALAAQRDPVSIGLWDVVRRMEGSTLRLGGAASEILSLAFRRDGTLLAAGRGDGRIALTNAAVDREIRILDDRHGGVLSLAFSPDDRQLAAGSRDGTIVLWDVDSGSQALVMRRHQGTVTALAFTPDGSRLASSGIDGTVVIWNLATGQANVILEGHGAYVVGLAISRDGARLASASWDGTVMVWDARVDDWHLRACEIANRQLTPEEWTMHVGEGVPYRPVCPR